MSQEKKLLIEQIDRLIIEAGDTSFHDKGDLWLIQLQNESKGPLFWHQIYELAVNFGSELSQCSIYNLEEKKWLPLFSHPKLQKRKSAQKERVFKNSEKRKNEFFVLDNGLRKGPYTRQEIIQRLETNSIKYDTLLSSDGGKTWRKAYHFPDFDRRKTRDIATVPETSLDEEKVEKSRVFTKEYLDSLRESEAKSGNAADPSTILEATQKYKRSSNRSLIPDLDFSKIHKNARTGGITQPPKKQLVRFGILAGVLLLVITTQIDPKKGRKGNPFSDILGEGDSPGRQISGKEDREGNDRADQRKRDRDREIRERRARDRQRGNRRQVDNGALEGDPARNRANQERRRREAASQRRQRERERERNTKRRAARDAPIEREMGPAVIEDVDPVPVDESLGDFDPDREENEEFNDYDDEFEEEEDERAPADDEDYEEDFDDF